MNVMVGAFAIASEKCGLLHIKSNTCYTYVNYNIIYLMSIKFFLEMLKYLMYIHSQ